MFLSLDGLRKDSERTTQSIKKKADAIKQRLAAALGDAEVGVVDGFKVSYPTISVGDKVTKGYSFRRMSIKELKEVA